MKGVREFRWGRGAYVKVAGKQIQRTFPPGTDAATINLWKAEMRAKHPTPARGTLAADVSAYLRSLGPEPQVRPDGTLIRHTTTRKRLDMAYALEPWLRQYGHLPRRSLQYAQIRDVLTELRAVHGASTVNHIRTGLLSLWRWAEGHSRDCPARQVPPYEEPKPEPRGVDPALLDQVFAVMPESRTKARLLLAWATGARPVEIMAIRPDELDPEADTLFLRAAKHGHDRRVPLNATGKAAARLFKATNAYGPYSTSSARLVLLRACRAAGLDVSGMTPYVLRHTCLTELRKAGADLADVQAIAGHRSAQTTARYAPVVPEKLAAAMARLTRPADTAA